MVLENNRILSTAATTMPANSSSVTYETRFHNLTYHYNMEEERLIQRLFPQLPNCFTLDTFKGLLQ